MRLTGASSAARPLPVGTVAPDHAGIDIGIPPVDANSVN